MESKRLPSWLKLDPYTSSCTIKREWFEYILQIFITNDVELIKKRRYDRTLLLKVDFDDPELVQKLLDSSDLIEGVRNWYGQNIIHKAVIHGNLESVKLVLDAGLEGIDEFDDWKYRPLCYAVWYGSVELVRLLVESGRCRIRGTNLRSAADQDNWEILQYLLDKVSPEDFRSKSYPDGIVARLMQIYRDAKAIDAHRLCFIEDPLTTALIFGQIQHVKLLLDHGADVRSDYYLHKVARLCGAEKLEKVKLLIATGLNVNERDGSGRTPIFESVVFSASPSIIKLLIEYGADVALKTNDGRSLVHRLGRSAHDDAQDRLLECLAPFIRENPRIEQEDVQSIVDNEHLRKSYVNCTEELEKLKLRKFYNDLTLLDGVLLANVYALTRYARNAQLVEAFAAADKAEFPIYRGWINDKFEAAVERCRWLRSVAAFFSQVFRLNSPFHVVTVKIMSYMNDYELQRIEERITLNS